MQYFLGVDIGTYEAKGILCDEQGKIIAQAVRAHQMLVPQAGWAEHDADADWWGGFCALTRELLAKSALPAAKIASVATSGIGPCMLPVDDQGTALMKAVLYGVDARATQEIDELTGEIGKQTLLRDSGNLLSSQSVGPKILWLKKNRPEIFARTHKILTSTSLLVYRLTGNSVIDHYSAASFHPLYNIETQDWQDIYADRIIAAEFLPSLKWTTDIAGLVTDEAARQTGLQAGTPVITGTIDAAAEAISIGVNRGGEMMMMYGSTMFFIQVTDKPHPHPALWYAPWLFEGQHASLAGTSTSGTLTRWFCQQFARDLPPAQAMSQLAEEAASSPAGARGLFMLPYFSGERTPLYDPQARGVIFGLDLSHDRGDIYRALIEGIAYGVRDVLSAYGAAGLVPTTIASAGGGLKNGLWAQAVCDIIAQPQCLREKTIGAAYGDCFLGALAVGAVTVQDIERWNPIVKILQPDATLVDFYAQGFKVFKALYEQTKVISKKGE